MWHTKSINSIVMELKTNIDKGLTDKQVVSKRKEYGENKLKEAKKESVIIKFIKQFKDFMIIVLLVAAIISAVVSYFENTNEYIDSIIIVTIVVFNALMGLIQESKAEKSLEALKKLSSPNAKVKRDNKITVIKAEEVVVGDILILETGSYVCSDARLINAFNLMVEESTLTGETLPVNKNSSDIFNKEVPIGDTTNMVFASTLITNGHGEAIVVDTGMNTKVGKIANMIIENEAPETPLQKKLSDVGKKLGIFCLFVCIVIFILGLIKQISVIDIFMTSVGLAVAAIPEGLPAIVTIMLSIGVTKMAKKNAIIRKLPAVETLGSSSIICTDKTGTLTENKMEVVKVADVNGIIDKNFLDKTSKEIIKLGSMCNDSVIEYSKNMKYTILGDPTENAIIACLTKLNETKESLYKLMPRVNEISFDSTRKMMTTIHKVGNKYRIITKGAYDKLINVCNKCSINGEVELFSSSYKSKVNRINEEMSSNALRVIAIAYADVDVLPSKIDSINVEKNLTFVGLIGMIDPPRPKVKEAVHICKKAGIKVVMITGDHILTAKAIGYNLGILDKNDLAITGEELDKLSDRDLLKNIKKYSVFARVSPEHKVRIVKLFRNTGAVVAMTGDGVNDAPALKNADIGISMGISGTDVAKNASDMILTDDNFVTIVEAVKEGRHIYDNIRKAVRFLLSSNIGEIVTIFLGILLGYDTPLLAVHLLWVNLITDSLPAIALGMEAADRNIMYKKPKNPKKGLFADKLLSKIIFEGILIGILTLISFDIGVRLYNLEIARTMAFVTLSMLELVHSFSIRSDESIFKIGIFSNKYMVGAFLLGTFLQLLVILSPLAKFFDVVNLNVTQWLTVMFISLIPLIVMESKKKFVELTFGRVVSSSMYEKAR